MKAPETARIQLASRVVCSDTPAAGKRSSRASPIAAAGVNTPRMSDSLSRSSASARPHGVGPNGGDHDLGAGGHGLQRRRQRRVGGQDRPGLRGFAQGFANGEHPLRRPAGQRDPGISPGPGQVFGGQLADEAGRPVQHDVEFTRRSGHGFDATPGCASRRRPARRGYPANAARSQPPGSAPPGSRWPRTPSHRWHARCRR